MILKHKRTSQHHVRSDELQDHTCCSSRNRASVILMKPSPASSSACGLLFTHVGDGFVRRLPSYVHTEGDGESL